MHSSLETGPCWAGSTAGDVKLKRQAQKGVIAQNGSPFPGDPPGQCIDSAPSQSVNLSHLFSRAGRALSQKPAPKTLRVGPFWPKASARTGRTERNSTWDMDSQFDHGP